MTEKALLLRTIQPEAGELLSAAGFDVDTFGGSVSEDQLARYAAEATILGVRTKPQLPASVFGATNKLATVGIYSVGFNHVDLAAANRNGVAVFNSPTENTRSVAEHDLGAMLTLSRKYHEQNRSMHGDGQAHGRWAKPENGTYELRGKTVAIFGHGNVGVQASAILDAVGMKVLVCDPAPRYEIMMGNARMVSQKEALQQADFVTIHTPGGEVVIGQAELALMKPGSFLINAARAEAVDEEAVREALDSNHLAGYAVDVYEKDPAEPGDPFDHPLRGHPKVFFTSHSAGTTVEAQQMAAQNTTGKILGFMATRSTDRSLTLTRDQNHPESSPKLTPTPLQVRSGTTRLFTVHRNVSGALDHITHPLSKAGHNILGSGLVTDAEIGVGYIDIDNGLGAETLRQIQSTPEKIKLDVVLPTQN